MQAKGCSTGYCGAMRLPKGKNIEKMSMFIFSMFFTFGPFALVLLCQFEVFCGAFLQKSDRFSHDKLKSELRIQQKTCCFEDGLFM